VKLPQQIHPHSFGKGGLHELTIPLSKHTNVATFSTAPGYDKYNNYCHKVEIDQDEDNILYAQDTGVVPDDKEDDTYHPP
jgi:hypothetical protein